MAKKTKFKDSVTTYDAFCNIRKPIY